MTWEEMCHVSTKFPALCTLIASINQLSFLPQTPLRTLSSTLTSLYLELNDFTSIADVASLAALTSLRNLHLKGNRISSLAREGEGDNSKSKPLPVFPDSLQYLDISYNRVSTWAFVDELPTCFPGLTSLRFAHNPIYDDPDPGFTPSSSSSSSQPRAAVATEEAYMFTVGRLGSLRALNFGAVSADDRQDAEMFYLARIGKHLAAAPEGRAADVLRGHRRYEELCALYGPPVVNRAQEVNPAFLEARLVTVRFVLHRHPMPQDEASGDEPVGAAAREETARIPKSFDIYAVKGIAGRLFGAKPLSLRLVWETGEWDPVAGFDDEVEDSSDEEGGEEGPELAPTGGAHPKQDIAETKTPTGEGRAGKWVKREVELHDGPRQLGFCVDGLEANIRVEVR